MKHCTETLDSNVDRIVFIVILQYSLWDDAEGDMTGADLRGT